MRHDTQVPSRRPGCRLGDERGVALIIALLAMTLMTALGMALMLVSETETLIGANYRDSVEGLPGDAKEALAFAILGFLTFNGLPGTLPSGTGARRATLLGSITPGAQPLRLPDPVVQAPRLLRIAEVGDQTPVPVLDGNPR